MDLRVAVLARAPDHAWTLSSPLQRTGSRLPVPVERAVMTYREVVALLAEVGTRPHEQLVMVGTMRLMTVDAALADRRMFPEERPPLFGVAGVADVVDGIGVQQRHGSTSRAGCGSRRRTSCLRAAACANACGTRHAAACGTGSRSPRCSAGPAGCWPRPSASGLWQSAQPRLLFSCLDPGQCMRVPPSWQVRHWAFCTSTGVPQRLVNPISAVLSSGVPGVVRARSVAGFAALPLTHRSSDSAGRPSHAASR